MDEPEAVVVYEIDINGTVLDLTGPLEPWQEAIVAQMFDRTESGEWVHKRLTMLPVGLRSARIADATLGHQWKTDEKGELVLTDGLEDFHDILVECVNCGWTFCQSCAEIGAINPCTDAEQRPSAGGTEGR